MRVDLRVPVAAEVIAWQGVRPCTTVVVKATFRVERGRFVLSAARPLVDDQHSKQGALTYASDRVPWKASSEVMLVGHAKSRSPSCCITAALALGDSVQKRFFAMSGQPATWVPLRKKYLRKDTQGSGSVRVGPKSVSHPGWRARVLPQDIDYATFNAAPSDQRLHTLAPGMLLTVEGLLEGVHQQQFRLPRWQPSATLSRQGTPVPLVCDTLWFDVDEGVAQMVWRGLCPFQDPQATVVIEKQSGAAGSQAFVPKIKDKLRRAGAGTLDVEPNDARRVMALPFSAATHTGPASPPPSARSPQSVAPQSMSPQSVSPQSVSPQSMSPQSMSPQSMSPQSMSPQSMSPPRSKAAAARRIVAEGTQEFTIPTLGLGTSLGVANGRGIRLGTNQPLPFEKPAPEPQKPAPEPRKPAPEPRSSRLEVSPPMRSRQETVTIEEIPISSELGLFGEEDTTSVDLPFLPGGGRELPFRPADPNAVQAPPITDEPLPAAATGATITFSELDVPVTALPFDSAEEPTSVALVPPLPAPPVSPVMPRPMVVPTSPLAAAPPPPPTTPQRPAPPTLPMAVVAAVKAAMLDGVPLKDALVEHDIPPHKWHLHERRMAVQFARAAERGDTQLAAELDAAVSRAVEERAAAQPNTTDDDDLLTYVTVTVELEEAADPHQVMAELNLNAEKWQALRRRWIRRTMRNPKLAEEVRKQLSQQRRAMRLLSQQPTSSDNPPAAAGP